MHPALRGMDGCAFSSQCSFLPVFGSTPCSHGVSRTEYGLMSVFPLSPERFPGIGLFLESAGAPAFHPAPPRFALPIIDGGVGITRCLTRCLTGLRGTGLKEIAEGIKLALVAVATCGGSPADA